MSPLDNFNPDEHVGESFDLLPLGEYIVAITESEERDTSEGNGSYYLFTLEILDGDFKGRKVWDMMCTEHPNRTTVNIAKARLGDYYRATGKRNIKETSELHNIPFKVKIGTQKGKNGYEDKSAVKKVLWQESTKPNVGSLVEKPTAAKPSAMDDDLPAFLK